jgi:DNA-binding response OmpR family regulator
MLLCVVRVLVVDDEPAIRALVAKIVQRSGFEAEVARDGEEAIAKLDAHDFDVVILDLMMPRVDGYGVIDHVRKLEAERRPAVIVVSAADGAAFRRLDGQIVHSVIRKPFDIDVLADLISAVAESREPSAKTSSNVVPFRRDETG